MTPTSSYLCRILGIQGGILCELARGFTAFSSESLSFKYVGITVALQHLWGVQRLMCLSWIALISVCVHGLVAKVG